MPELRFTEQGHRYTVGGLWVPSTTQVIEASAPLTDFAKDPKAAAFGSEFHHVSAYADQGELDQYDYNHAMDPWLDGWRKFRRDFPMLVPFRMGGKPAIEMRLYSDRYGYAGTIDRVWRNPQDRYVIVNDIKTGSKCATWDLQTAAYTGLFMENVQPARFPVKRWITQVGEGTYKLHIPRNPWRMDLTVYLAMLTVHNWNREHNKLPKESAE